MKLNSMKWTAEPTRGKVVYLHREAVPKPRRKVTFWDVAATVFVLAVWVQMVLLYTTGEGW